MKHILILISFFFLSSLLYGKSKINGLLYTWKNGSTYVGEWKDDKKMVKGNTFMEKEMVKVTSMKGNGKMIKSTVKVNIFGLMETSL